MNVNPEDIVFAWLDLFTGPACAKIAENSPIPLKNDAFKALKNTLRVRLLQIADKTLLSECRRHIWMKHPSAMTVLQLVPDKIRREAAEAALEELLAGGTTALDAEYPLLRPRMETVISHFVLAAQEMLSRISCSRSQISGLFFEGAPFTEIRMLDFRGADTHNFGRATVKIITDRGAFMYKPHDVRQDVYIRRLIKTYFRDIIRVPKCLACCEESSEARYGFCEFIINRPAATEADAKRFYYNLGGFAAVTQMLGSTDMHFNNILADGTRPAPVDMETCFTPVYRLADGFENEMPLWRREMSFSVIGNGMFPYRMGSHELSILIGRSSENVSMPVTGGIARTVYGFLDDYYCGFADVYRSILKRRKSIRSDLKAAPDFDVRILLRGTDHYVKTARLTTDRECLNDRTEAERCVSEWLANNPTRLPDDKWEKVRMCEFSSIFREDIPYFHTKAKSLALYDPAGTVIKDVFWKSPLDAALYRLEHMSEAEMNFELQLQRESIERACRPADGEKEDEPQKADSEEELLERILKEVVVTPSGEPLWFINFKNRSRVCMAADYYQGVSGMMPVLAAYRRAFPDTAYSAQIGCRLESCLAQIEYYIKQTERRTDLRYPEFNGSRKSGCSGLIEGLMRLYEFEPDERYPALAKRLVQFLERYSCENCSELSMRDGIAGILATLCRYRDRLGIRDEQIRRYADLLIKNKTEPVGTMLLWHPTVKPRVLSGLDIGIGGIGLALHMAGKLLKEEHYLKAAEDAFAYERSVYSEAAGGWPDMTKSTACPERFGGYHSGNAGLGFLWLYLKEKDLLQKAADAALNASPVFSDRLYDGNLGTYDFLLEAGRVLHRKDLSEKAIKILEAYKNSERHYQDEEFEQVFEPSAFFGEAGYLFLRLRALFSNEIPSLLSL